MSTEHVEYPAGAASEKFRELIALGWDGTGTEGHEISRALGCAWPVAVLTMTAPGSRKKQVFRFVGKPDNNIHLYSK